MTGPIQRKIAGPFSYVDTGSICQGVREWVWHKDVFAFKYFPPIPLRWGFKKRKKKVLKLAFFLGRVLDFVLGRKRVSFYFFSNISFINYHLWSYFQVFYLFAVTLGLRLDPPSLISVTLSRAHL